MCSVEMRHNRGVRQPVELFKSDDRILGYILEPQTYERYLYPDLSCLFHVATFVKGNEPTGSEQIFQFHTSTHDEVHLTMLDHIVREFNARECERKI